MAAAKGSEGGGSNGKGVLAGVNQSLVGNLLKGEAAVAAVAVVLAVLTKTNPLSGFVADGPSLTTAAIAAIPIFVGSVFLERSNIELFKSIDRDTQLFVVQLFGAKRNLGGVVAPSLAMASAAAIAEELLFRGVLQQAGAEYIGALPALLVTSLLFGLAHNPVPGASSLVESVYGLTFGLLYLLSGGNIFLPIACHLLYDFATFLEVHLRATGSVGVIAEGVAKGETQLDRNVKNLIAQYRLDLGFVKNALGVFKKLDMDGNEGIDRKELQLGIRTFGNFKSDDEIDKIYDRADTNNDGEVDFAEFLKVLIDNALALKKVQGKPSA